jgi:hypothetical protein
MNKSTVLIALIVCLSCSKKNVYDSGGKGDSLTGNWILVATQEYGEPFGEGPWKSVYLFHPVKIEFTIDSAFNYSPNFPWKGDKYDRFKKSGNDLFIYPSVYVSTFIWIPNIYIEQLNSNEIILVRHFIDNGEKEKYIRASE